MTFEHLNQNNVEEYITYLKAAMKEEPEKMTAERVDEQGIGTGSRILFLPERHPFWRKKTEK